MLTKIINWLRRVWRDDVPDAVERMWLDEYAPYIKERYGISEPFAPEENDKCKK